ncbi:Hypothetical predicted protein, partial [Cloeon dipterum]
MLVGKECRCLVNVEICVRTLGWTIMG